MKFTEHKAVLDIDPFMYTLHINFSNSVAEARRRCKALGPHAHGELDSANALHCWNDEHNSYVFYNTKALARTIAHESSHVVHRVLHVKGVCEIDEEVFAYHLGFVVHNTTRFQSTTRKSSKRRK